MTSINIPKDDVAVREARRRNSGTPAVQAPRETSSVKQAEPVSRQTRQPPRAALRRRAKKDRRQGERRKKQVDVLLDTRSHRERRKNTRRRSDGKTNEETSARNRRGIDVYT